jgi:nitrogen fixation protein
MDTKITKIISTIHFSLISLIIFITLISISLFIALQHGIVLKQINFLDFNVKGLHVRDNNRLSLNIESIHIYNSKKSHKSNFKYQDIVKLVNKVAIFLPLFESINIKSIKTDDTQMAISYKSNRPININLINSDVSLELSLRVTDKYLSTKIVHLDTIDKFLHVSGFANLNRVDNSIYAKLNTTILDRDKLDIYIVAQNEALQFNTKFLTPITTLKEIVDFTKLDKDISPWIVDYAKGNAPVLEKLSGYIPYNNPQYIVHTLKAQGYWEGISYYFQKGFEPAISHRVDLTFDNGILKIMPRNAFFYSHIGGNTSISIDFKPKEVMLSVHVDTTATLDRHLLDLIKSYDIDIPVEQKEGLTRADLSIYVNLRTTQINALGNFDVYKGVVSFHGVDYKVYGAKVKIKDSYVEIRDANISYKSLAKGILNADIQAAAQKGNIDIDIYDVNLSEKLTLKTKPLHVRYTMIPNSLDTIDVVASDWNILNKTLHVKAIKSNFNYNKLQAYIPKTDINITNSLQANINGCIDIAHEYYDFNTTLSKLNLFNLSLKQDSLFANFKYKDKLSVITKQNSSWDYSGLDILISELNSTIDLEYLKINSANFILEDDLQANIIGDYDITKKKGYFKLDNISVKNDKLGDILSYKESIPLKLKLVDDSFDIAIPQLNFTLMALKEGWRLNIPDISQFTKHSTLMQDFNISKGSLYIGKTKNRDDYYFTGNIDYEYPFLVQEKRPQYKYKFFGNFDNNTTLINVNDTLNIKIDDNISLTCKDTGFNINAFVDFIEDHNKSDSNESIPFTLNATNSFIYFSDDRKALADNITIKAIDKNIFATFVYKKGGAILEMHDKEFYLYGKHFSDIFMNNFLSLSKYKGGDFSFALRGNLKNFKGVARIDNSRIKDYVLFNNVLAFINTIPSLASFALPSYAKDGIQINEAYTAFEYRDNIMYFDAVKFDSGEVDIYGKGEADYLNDKINIKLNLKTHLGKNVSKVPVVGYILVGDDGTAATTFEITGKLTNPIVETALAKDIVIAPFNILKRAVVYPFHLLDTLVNEQNTTKELNPTKFLEN